MARPGEYAASAMLGGSTVPRDDRENLFAQAGTTVNPATGFVLTNDLRPVNYVDQMPPFDIVLSAQNEMGHRMGMQIFGVELLNQGSGVSIDD